LSDTTKPCPACGQTLRIPEGVGGVTMACPNCGHHIPSFFKLGGVKSSSSQTSAAQRPIPQEAPPIPEMPHISELKGIEGLTGAPAGKDMPDYPEAHQPRKPLLAVSGLTRYKLMMRQG